MTMIKNENENEKLLRLMTLMIRKIACLALHTGNSKGSGNEPSQTRNLKNRTTIIHLI